MSEANDLKRTIGSLASEIGLQKDILNKITTKTLIVWGEYDRIIDLECANILEKNIINSKKIVFKNVGHVPQMEVPEELGEVISSFL